MAGFYSFFSTTPHRKPRTAKTGLTQRETKHETGIPAGLNGPALLQHCM
jgi:hypothetical protein